jgi:hypothetical protein
VDRFGKLARKTRSWKHKMRLPNDVGSRQSCR